MGLYESRIMPLLLKRKVDKDENGNLFSDWCGWCCTCIIFWWMEYGACYIGIFHGSRLYIRACGCITENAGLMGLPLPEKIKWAIDVLQKRSKEGDVDNGEKHS